jgi:hypothetical protein
MAKPISLTPLAEEPRSVLPTAEAAKHINRTEQTLRRWASTGTGPLKPRRIGGRLGWSTAELRELMA